MSAPSKSAVRELSHRLDGRAAEDGGGVKLTRMFDPRSAALTDPFLLFDEFRSDSAADYIAGFPPHPHRGFETVTYMLAGRMRHGDSRGNRGDLGPGSIQWMTAGRGLVHEEMPQQESGLMWGYQLWVNLPAANKMDAPTYQDIAAERIPQVEAGDGVVVRVLAGRYGEHAGPVAARPTAPIYFDLTLPAGSRWQFAAPAGHTVLVHAVSGRVLVGERRSPLEARQLARLGDRGDVVLSGPDDAPARALLIAGRPLREPVAHYGPFVMNDAAQIQQAIEDFRAGRF